MGPYFFGAVSKTELAEQGSSGVYASTELFVDSQSRPLARRPRPMISARYIRSKRYSSLVSRLIQIATCMGQVFVIAEMLFTF